MPFGPKLRVGLREVAVNPRVATMGFEHRAREAAQVISVVSLVDAVARTESAGHGPRHAHFEVLRIAQGRQDRTPSCRQQCSSGESRIDAAAQKKRRSRVDSKDALGGGDESFGREVCPTIERPVRLWVVVKSIPLDVPGRTGPPSLRDGALPLRADSSVERFRFDGSTGLPYNRSAAKAPGSIEGLVDERAIASE